MREDPRTFDFNAHLYAQAVPEVWSGLVTFDPDGNPVGGWAETWAVSEDGSVVQFHIRPDNSGRTNGAPVTAHDFVWSFARLLSPEPVGATGQNSYSFILYDIKYGEAFSTNTPYAVEGDPLTGQVPTEADLGLRAVD